VKYSYSRIQRYAECPTKFKLHYQDNLTPLSGRSEHDLMYGSAIDAGLSAYYNTGNILLGLEAFTLSYPAHYYPSQLPYWSPGKTFQNGLNALQAYAEHYRDENRHWTVLKVQNISTGAEDESTYESDRVVKLDLVIRDSRDDLVYGVDFKTTGKYLDKDFSARFEIHSQIRQYVDWIQHTYGECGGFYIDALSFRHRQKAYTPSKGPDKGIQLTAGDWHAFKRMIFNPNSDAVAQEQANFANWVSKIEHDLEHDTWAYNTDQCVRGPLVCEYHAICSRGYQWPRDEALITNDYRQRCMEFAADGHRCWLEPAHEGEHDSVKPYLPEAEFELDDEVEEAEV